MPSGAGRILSRMRKQWSATEAVDGHNTASARRAMLAVHLPQDPWAPIMLAPPLRCIGRHAFTHIPVQCHQRRKAGRSRCSTIALGMGNPTFSKAFRPGPFCPFPPGHRPLYTLTHPPRLHLPSRLPFMRHQSSALATACSACFIVPHFVLQRVTSTCY